MSISNRLPEIFVEYDRHGKRVKKHFTDAYEARRFYAAKIRLGKHPKLVGTTKPRDGKHIAVYVRVSTKSQSHESQLPDLEQWAANQELPVHFYQDKASGRSMDRPGWKDIEKQIHMGKVDTLVVWRMDRLGRTVSGLSKLFETLELKKINLISLRDCVDLKTPAGRLLANVLASVAAYESEVKGERVRAGQEVARRAGKRWGGARNTKPWKVTDEVRRTIIRLNDEGVNKTKIAKTVNVSRQKVYDVLREHQNEKE